MAKITLLAAGAVGYVLGARAGRERYEQIAQQAQKVWRDPRVQQRKDEAASAVKETVTDAAQQASDVAKEKVSSATSSTSSSGTGTGSTSLADPTPPSGATGAGTASTGPVPDPAADPDRAPGQADESFPADPSQPERDV